MPSSSTGRWPTSFASARRSSATSSRRVESPMSKFVDQPLSGFLDALASAEPTPGGGTAAAIAGAMGVSLLMMVAGLTKPRAGAEAEGVALAEARAALAGIRDRLAGL